MTDNQDAIPTYDPRSPDYDVAAAQARMWPLGPADVAANAEIAAAKALEDAAVAAAVAAAAARAAG